jgi:hypothetical protein
MIDSKFSDFLALGLLTTIMKSCSALGPSLRVILLVSSLEIGFSMYHASCLISLFTMFSLRLPFSSCTSSENGSSGLPNLSLMLVFVKLKLLESIDSSTIYSELLRLPTFRVEPSSFPGKKVL